MRITRRHLLKMGAMAGAGLALPLGTLSIPVGRLAASAAVRSPDVEPFAVPLPIPPVARPAYACGADHYEMVQKAARQEILPGLKTEIWGYDGVFPGPTIEARRDRSVVIRQWNELPVPVSVHLHGGKTPPESDGYPTDLILPKEHDHGAHATHGAAGKHAHMFKDYSYPNAHRAATLWYHDHRMDFTGPQVYRGLAGMYVLRDDIEDGLPLPKGEKDVPLVITDRPSGTTAPSTTPRSTPTCKKSPAFWRTPPTACSGTPSS